jgi:hypothetical protein
MGRNSVYLLLSGCGTYNKKAGVALFRSNTCQENQLTNRQPELYYFRLQTPDQPISPSYKCNNLSLFLKNILSIQAYFKS